MKVHVIERCSWHRSYFGHFHVIRVITDEKPEGYRGPRIIFVNRICPACKKVLREEIFNKERGVFIYDQEEVL